MPAYPDRSARLEQLPGSVFSALAGRLKRRYGEVFPLHVGDTWLEPATGCRMEDLRVADQPGLHRYASTRGLPSLVSRVAERVTERSAVPTGPENVLISAGATAGLTGVMGALIDPGDEVLVVAPFWPLIAGIVRCSGGVPLAVPLLGERLTLDGAIDRLERQRSPRSVAVYFNTPNNPSGRVLPPTWVDAIARWAVDRGLWLVSDEVYEDYVFEGSHRYARAAAPDRTFAVHSFSKAYGMAGNRCGYVLGPAEPLAEIEKITTYSVYCAPHASQLAALSVLSKNGDAWLSDARVRYERAGRDAARRLGVDPPEGGTFLFVDVSQALDDRGLLGFLERCVDRGLLVAPGPSFGPYPNHVRLCFTCAEPATVERGVEILATLLER